MSGMMAGPALWRGPASDHVRPDGMPGARQENLFGTMAFQRHPALQALSFVYLHCRGSAEAHAAGGRRPLEAQNERIEPRGYGVLCLLL